MITTDNFKEVVLQLHDKDKKRIMSSAKEFIVLELSIFNVGSVTNCILTDNHYKYKNVSDNGNCIIDITEVQEIICQDNMSCLIDSHNGVYIPQIFFERYESQIKDFFNEKDFNEFKSDLSSPDNTYYYNSWNQLIDYSNFQLTIDDKKYIVLENADLFIYPANLELSDDWNL